MRAHTHTHTRKHTDSHTHAHTHTHTHTHTPIAYQGNQGNETEEKVFEKRKVFKEDLKELTAPGPLMEGVPRKCINCVVDFICVAVAVTCLEGKSIKI